MRVAFGQFSHESNSFCSTETELAQFEEQGIQSGDACTERYAGTHTVPGGFIEGGEREGMDLVAIVSASATPSGRVSAEAYGEIKRRLVEGIGAAKPLDGVLLSLHGAMVAAPVPDAEADILRGVRDAVGPNVPIVIVLDLHANVTPNMVAGCAVILGYNEEPHTDVYERGIEAAQVLARIIRDEIHPVTARVQPPLLLPAINMATEHGPMHDLAERRAELEALPGVINVSVFGGFYGSDQEEAGPSVIVTTDGDESLARDLAARLASEFWERRNEFIVPLIPIPEAIRRAEASPTTVGLVDECDDPAGGGAADGTAILRGMLEASVQRAGIATIRDPEVVARALEVGEGGMVEGSLGGKTDLLHGEPVTVRGCVQRIHRGALPMRPWSKMTVDVGPLIVLEVGGIDVIVTEQRVVSEDVDLFRLLGIDSASKSVLGLKGLGLHLKRAYKDTIEEFIPVAGEGVTNPDVTKLPFEHLRRPVFPLDDVASWSPQGDTVG